MPDATSQDDETIQQSESQTMIANEDMALEYKREKDAYIEQYLVEKKNAVNAIKKKYSAKMKEVKSQPGGDVKEGLLKKERDAEIKAAKDAMSEIKWEKLKELKRKYK